MTKQVCANQIAVLVDEYGNWVAFGSSFTSGVIAEECVKKYADNPKCNFHVVFVDVMVDLPEVGKRSV